MDLIITGRVSANEQSPSIHLLNLFQFPRGSMESKREAGAGGGRVCVWGGNDYIFLVALINYVTDEI